MRNFTKGLICGICGTLVCILLLTVYASVGEQSITVLFDDIKVRLNGVRYTMKDVNGEEVEPFIYNGTTYVPIRGMAKLLDKTVEWDENRKIVEIVDLEKAYTTLCKATSYSIGPVGPGALPDGVISVGDYAFALLYKSDNALEYFKKMEEEGTNAGKLYALCGLYLLDKPYYDMVVEKYRDSEEVIATMSGCIGSHRKMGEIIENIDTGKAPNALKPARQFSNKLVEEAYSTLVQATCFSYGGLGYSGTTIDDRYAAFYTLYSSSDALNYFKGMEKEGTNEGKLFALCGLYLLDKEYYNSVAEKYLSREEPVMYQSGCLRWEDKLCDIIKSDIETGYAPEFLKENHTSSVSIPDSLG